MAKFCSNNGKFCSEGGKICIEAPVGIYLGNAAQSTTEGFIRSSLAGVQLETVTTLNGVNIVSIVGFKAYIAHTNFFSNPALSKIDLNTLTVDWTWTPPAEVPVRSVSVSDGVVYIAMVPNPGVSDLYGVNDTTGAALWDVNNIAEAFQVHGAISGGGAFFKYSGFTPVETSLHSINGSTGAKVDTLAQSVFPTLTNPVVQSFDVLENPNSQVVIISLNGSTGNNVDHWVARVNNDLDTLLAGPTNIGLVPTTNTIPYQFIIHQENNQLWFVDATPTAPNIYRFNATTLAASGTGQASIAGLTGKITAAVVYGDDEIVLIDGSDKLFLYNIATDTTTLLTTITGTPPPVLTGMDIIRVDQIT